MSRVKIAHFSPSRILFMMVFATIVIGTLLLMLPCARTQEISFLDLFFTATSATCVTGLFTVPLDHFTTTGHAIILLLSQIGGIGLVTLTIFLFSLFVNFGFATQLIAGQLLHLESWKNIRTFIGFIVGLTVCVEFIGACCFFALFITDMPWHKALFAAAFHAVAAFCNTGIIVPHSSSYTYDSSLVMALTATALMVFGSLGFVTWNEIVQYCRALIRRKRYTFSLHSKIIFYGTAIIIATTCITFALLEWNNALQGQSLTHKLVNTLFQAVSFRSAGFATPLFSLFYLPTLLLIVMAAFFGGSPGSTSGGVKITTITILLASIRSAITGRLSVELRGRSIPIDQVYRAIAIVFLSIEWIFLTTFVLSITEQGQSFLALLFEASSAFCNLGMSLGTTPFLSLYGKAIIIASMIIGRIGSLTLVLALKAITTRRKQEGTEFSYPEERVILS